MEGRIREGVQTARGSEEKGEMGALGVGQEEKGAVQAPCGMRTRGGGGEGWCLSAAGEGWRERGMPSGRMNTCTAEAVGARRALRGVRGGGSLLRAGIGN